VWGSIEGEGEQMMFDILLNAAGQDLRRIISMLKPGEEASIIDNGKRVAVLRRDPVEDYSCKAGSAAGKILYMADDFDKPLDDFSEYST
jgi:hypothetical protein